MSVKISQVATRSSSIWDPQIRKTNNGMRNIFVQVKGRQKKEQKGK